MSKPVCTLIGVGPGNGTAIARKFSSEGYKIALLSRSESVAAIFPPHAGKFSERLRQIKSEQS
jgi:NAD(P)-dependent dehydrogenase (short-subunit alcohol dehydrogenase family)